MILKYISYFCQKELLHSSQSSPSRVRILDALKQSGSLGIYFRYKDDFGTLFRFLNCSKNGREQLFLYYFEMYVLDELLRIFLDFEKEKERLKKEQERLKKELARSKGMLSNEKFLSKAPEAKVLEEKEKLAKYEQMMQQVEERLSQMK